MRENPASTALASVVMARDSFEEDVPVGEQADQQRVDQMALAHDDLAHFGTERIDEDRFAFDSLVEFLDVDDFAHLSMLSLFRIICSIPAVNRLSILGPQRSCPFRRVSRGRDKEHGHEASGGQGAGGSIGMAGVVATFLTIRMQRYYFL